MLPCIQLWRWMGPSAASEPIWSSVIGRAMRKEHTRKCLGIASPDTGLLSGDANKAWPCCHRGLQAAMRAGTDVCVPHRSSRCAASLSPKPRLPLWMEGMSSDPHSAGVTALSLPSAWCLSSPAVTHCALVDLEKRNLNSSLLLWFPGARGNCYPKRCQSCGL